ncbi:hypothetical protein P3342_008447 [Pyrenophora teres f. teres]|nr:hypothetical protein P3342_008447 [Pyrenophora teres f. teres]CAE7185845.1 hypothetical protein PTTW11_06874 [Pyrenophora teres f. teres]
MLLPIKLIWNLQMPCRKKAGIFVLFGSGFVCIAFATLRVVQLGVDGRGRTTTPEPKWLLLWTVLECAMTIIIGSSPVFATLIRTRISTSKPPYNFHNRRGSNDVRMKTIGSYSKGLRRSHMNPCWDNWYGSQEELAKSAGRIMFETTVHQDDEMASKKSNQKMNGAK